MLNVFGKAFCQSCMTAFYGRYDAENPALKSVIACIAAKKTLRSGTVSGSEAQRQLFELERQYSDRVRRISKVNLRRNPQIVNPRGHVLGRSGATGAYQLDHIVPVSTCWEHYVSAEDAASVPNLQVIPWFVNISRGAHFDLERLVGCPPRSAASFA